MSSLRLPRDFDSAKGELLGLLRTLLLGRKQSPLMVYPGFPRLDDDASGSGTGMKRSDSEISNISDYLDVERSKSLHSALKKCSRTVDEKKVVSFADAMGLDLCQVRPVFPYNTSDEDMFTPTPTTVPIVRCSSRQRPVRASPSGSLNSPRYLHLRSTSHPSWRDHLSVNKELVRKARTNNVCLKTTNVIGTTFSGIIAVNNIAFDKKVSVRYSLDNWRSFIDVACQYVYSSAQDQLDHFSFSIYLPPTMPIGAKCEFCIRYQCGALEYWDNNNGTNYILEVRTMADSYTELNRDFEQPLFY